MSEPTQSAESVASGWVDDTVSEATWMARSARGHAARWRQKIAELRAQVDDFEFEAKDWDRQEEFWMARMSEDERAYYLRHNDGDVA